MSDPFDTEAGTREFYLDPVYYDYEFKSRVDDLRFYVERYVAHGAPVLELAVGSGRIAAKAVKKGAHVVGIDIGAEMLEQAERRRQTLPEKHRGRLELHTADMRDFDLDRLFGLITCPFNAFQHLYTRDDVEGCLACVRDHLEPDGEFIVDMLLPDVDYLSRPPTRWYGGSRFKHPRHNAWYTYAERSAWDPVRQINQIWFRFSRDPVAKWGPEEEVSQLSHRYFSPTEMEALLHYNGFEVTAMHGDFDGGPLRGDCESMVVTARLRR